MNLQQAQQEQKDMKMYAKIYLVTGNSEKTEQVFLENGGSPVFAAKMREQHKKAVEAEEDHQRKLTGDKALAYKAKKEKIASVLIPLADMPEGEEKLRAFYQTAESLMSDGTFTDTEFKQVFPEGYPGPVALKMTALKYLEIEKQLEAMKAVPVQVEPAGSMERTPEGGWKQLGAPKPTPARVNYKEGTIIGADGVTRDINDPNLNAADKTLVAAAKRAHGEELGEQADKEARAAVRQEKIRDAREAALTSPTKTMIETAPKVRELANRVIQLTNQQLAQLGPASGRWSEFMTGTVGAPNKDFARLRTDVSLLRTLLMRMHMGARGGVMLLGEFKTLIDAGMQAPDNLVAAAEEIQAYADDLIKFGAEHGHAVTPKGGGGTVGKPKAGADPLGIF
jgi:hypothetical protein